MALDVSTLGRFSGEKSQEHLTINSERGVPWSHRCGFYVDTEVGLGSSARMAGPGVSRLLSGFGPVARDDS